MDQPHDEHAGHHGHSHDHGHEHATASLDADCQQAVEELYSFLDGHLTDAKRVDIQQHLDDCSPCLEAFEFETELRAVVAQRCKEEVPDSLRRKIADLIDAAGDPDRVGAGD